MTDARLSLAAKLTVVSAITMIVVLALVVPIAAATADRGLGLRVLVLIPPLAIPVVAVFAITRLVVRRATVPLIDAYQRVAAGDFRSGHLPLIVGSDFESVRTAFAAMGAALERSIAQLREADLERRRLFADLAHELATPTTTLLGIAHALRESDVDRGRLLDHLERESARLERLIADIREVAHLEDPTLPMLLEVCDVGALVTGVVDRARLAAAGACTLACQVVSASARVDPLRIEQVLTNLLDNAARHARGGTVCVALTADADAVVVRVEDSGAGVPDELLAGLGRRLLRIDPSRSRDTGGHGLGLAIVRGIVARHHGEVSFARAALGGLAAEIRLPRAPPPT